MNFVRHFAYLTFDNGFIISYPENAYTIISIKNIIQRNLSNWLAFGNIGETQNSNCDNSVRKKTGKLNIDFKEGESYFLMLLLLKKNFPYDVI